MDCRELTQKILVVLLLSNFMRALLRLRTVMQPVKNVKCNVRHRKKNERNIVNNGCQIPRFFLARFSFHYHGSLVLVGTWRSFFFLFVPFQAIFHNFFVRFHGNLTWARLKFYIDDITRWRDDMDSILDKIVFTARIRYIFIMLINAKSGKWRNRYLH